MSRIVVGPFNRVEGDLEVSLEIAEGRVQQAKVNSPLYRGFEQILQGRPPMDALVYTPRICGICSVSQSVASARALADAMQLSPNQNGQLAQNIVLANENLADLLTHFYLFFMPDFARDEYAKAVWFPEVAERFKAQKGSATKQVLPARAAFLHVMGLMAGKWPHSLSIQPGGSAKPVDRHERLKLLMIISSFRQFLEEVVFDADLESVAEISSIEALNQYRDANHWSKGDFRAFLHISEQQLLDQLGRATDRFMSFGNYPLHGKTHFRRGVSGLSGEVESLNLSKISEDLSHSWMAGERAHPAHGITLPSLDNTAGYSWCKAPRLDGEVVETGALARQQVDGHPLIRALVAQSGGNVQNRMIARLLELALVVPQMQQWLTAIKVNEPFCEQAKLPESCQGVGLVEAARGSLGHWISIRKGKIENYQVIAPTTWNFSPRDQQGQPGALEQALENTPVLTSEKEPVNVQHIVRSFDPCMVCTVH